MTLLMQPAPAARAVDLEVLFFGAIADIFGSRTRLAIGPEGASLAELRRLLSRIGGDAILRSDIRVAVDQTLVHGEATVRPGQEVAFMSPFSGG